MHDNSVTHVEPFDYQNQLYTMTFGVTFCSLRNRELHLHNRGVCLGSSDFFSLSSNLEIHVISFKN